MTTNPAAVYTDAPRILSEIAWVAEAAMGRPADDDREFRLRKAALLDRIALEETATYAPEVAAKAVATADEAARRFVAYDVARTGHSQRALDVATADDCRDYVREQYRAWSLARLR
ncbi:hypothetical protein [Streptomyces sp. CC77]|uniref:hypothetical protein n=1 Tax=Streptomyces sp. CC77 TaxID=1906739 RepID=UPI0008DD5CF5|nr:hypothetical protein [Streptomyces sp. CC77]OII67462.1 hypothetical protein BJP39_00990 [Streptomyces sp. CC77]